MATANNAGNNSATNTSSASEHTHTDDLARKAHDTVNKAHDTVDRVEQRARDFATEAEHRAREQAEYSRQKAEELTGSMTSYVYEKPLSSLGIAFGAGILISAILRK